MWVTTITSMWNLQGARVLWYTVQGAQYKQPSGSSNTICMLHRRGNVSCTCSMPHRAQLAISASSSAVRSPCLVYSHYGPQGGNAPWSWTKAARCAIPEGNLSGSQSTRSCALRSGDTVCQQSANAATIVRSVRLPLETFF